MHWTPKLFYKNSQTKLCSSYLPTNKLRPTFDDSEGGAAFKFPSYTNLMHPSVIDPGQFIRSHWIHLFIHILLFLFSPQQIHPSSQMGKRISFCVHCPTLACLSHYPIPTTAPSRWHCPHRLLYISVISSGDRQKLPKNLSTGEEIDMNSSHMLCQHLPTGQHLNPNPTTDVVTCE